MSFASGPVPNSTIEAYLNDYLSQFKQKKIVKYEVTESSGYLERTKDGLPRSVYFQQCYYFWEGNYGQIVQETVSVSFINLQGQWSYDRTDPVSGQTQIVQNPTKPLPPVPEQPGYDLIVKTVESSLANINPDYSYKVNKLTLSKPKFDRYGWNYEWGGFLYPTATIEYTKKNRYKSFAGKETWRGECKLYMFYNIADKNWVADFKWLKDQVEL